jgi:hypothetical protein
MKIRTFVLASVALFVSGVSSAMSGPCKTEIDGLTKTLAAQDAGSYSARPSRSLKIRMRLR